MLFVFYWKIYLQYIILCKYMDKIYWVTKTSKDVINVHQTMTDVYTVDLVKAKLQHASANPTVS